MCIGKFSLGDSFSRRRRVLSWFRKFCRQPVSYDAIPESRAFTDPALIQCWHFSRQDCSNGWIDTSYDDAWGNQPEVSIQPVNYDGSWSPGWTPPDLDSDEWRELQKSREPPPKPVERYGLDFYFDGIPRATQVVIEQQILSEVEECCRRHVRQNAPDDIVLGFAQLPGKYDLSGIAREWAPFLRFWPSTATELDLDQLRSRLLGSLCQYRHAVVHRRPLCPEWLKDALQVPKCLKDDELHAKFEEVCAALKTNVAAGNENVTEDPVVAKFLAPPVFPPECVSLFRGIATCLERICFEYARQHGEAEKYQVFELYDLRHWIEKWDNEELSAEAATCILPEHWKLFRCILWPKIRRIRNIAAHGLSDNDFTYYGFNDNWSEFRVAITFALVLGNVAQAMKMEVLIQQCCRQTSHDCVLDSFQREILHGTDLDQTDPKELLEGRIDVPTIKQTLLQRFSLEQGDESRMKLRSRWAILDVVLRGEDKLQHEKADFWYW